MPMAPRDADPRQSQAQGGGDEHARDVPDANAGPSSSPMNGSTPAAPPTPTAAASSPSTNWIGNNMAQVRQNTINFRRGPAFRQPVERSISYSPSPYPH